MGVYIEYNEFSKTWHVFGCMGYGFYDTEEEAREVYERLLKIFNERESEENRLEGSRAWV